MIKDLVILFCFLLKPFYDQYRICLEDLPKLGFCRQNGPARTRKRGPKKKLVMAMAGSPFLRLYNTELISCSEMSMTRSQRLLFASGCSDSNINPLK